MDIPSTIILQDLIRCINFAAIKHKDQRRKDPESTPYINHPIGVAHILLEEGGVSDLEVLEAALLHDTVEDTDTSFEEIEAMFGPRVCAIVREVTDDKTLPKATRKLLQAQKNKVLTLISGKFQIETAPKSSKEAKLVKMADKLYNLRDLRRCTPEGWTQPRVDEYFEWASKVIDGLRGTNKILEEKLDLVLKNKS
ncbi:hypothetical protein AAG570_000104 [Ranatra chinensis]|uniref:Guanosine-3',5'-bis(diphosphate) 3'-pyrophosphohydrolase MESH1 n=1 Tax=Ranatra chinensis TaxID=642074 RepID=A0ABD0Z6J8_9HEMI